MSDDFNYYRLRRLLEEAERDNDCGNLSTQKLKQTVLETASYGEPAASDIRNILGGLSAERFSQEELRLRIKQAKRTLYLSEEKE